LAVADIDVVNVAENVIGLLAVPPVSPVELLQAFALHKSVHRKRIAGTREIERDSGCVIVRVVRDYAAAAEPVIPNDFLNAREEAASEP
jgi:hypothetical protein